ASKSNITTFPVKAKVHSSDSIDLVLDLPDNSTNGTLVVKLPEDATGNVTVIIDGKEYNVTNVTNGTAVVYITEILPGNHTVEVIYSGDGNYTGVSNTTNIEVPKVSDYDISVDAVVNGHDVEITVYLPTDVDGVVLIDVGDVGYYANASNGQAKLYLKDVVNGKYGVTAKYLGDDYYAPRENTTSFTVDAKVKPEIEIEIDIPENATNGTVTVELPEDATGNVTVVIDGKVYNVTNVTNGTATVQIGNMTPGNHTVEVIYSGDGNYSGASASDIVNVPKVSDYPFNVTAKDINVGDKTDIVVKLPSDVNGVVLLDIDGVGYYVNVTNGTAKFDLALDLKPGTYDVTVTYVGDDKYASKQAVETFTISGNAPEVDIKVSGDEIVVELPDDATGNVTVTIDGKDYIIPVENGTAKMNISDLEPGNHTVDVKYGGDDKYTPASNSTVINVPKISDYPIDVSYDNDKVTVELPEDATGELEVTIDNKTYTVPIVDGKAVVDISNLPAGKHDVQVAYPGDDKYAPATVNATIDKGHDLVITAPDVVKYYSGPDRFVVYTKDDKGNNVDGITVVITINGVSYTRTTSGGEASIALNLNCGNYTVNVDFAGNNDFKAQSVNSTVEILHTIYANDLLKVYRNATQFWALFTDSEGNPLADTMVTFNINGVFYNRTTNATGWAKLNINLDAGSYILTSYNPVTGEERANTVTVFTLIESSDLTKYHRNGSHFVVRVRGADGNWAKAGEEVKFNINGVFYTRYTNETGHAQLNINIQPGEYIITTYYKDCVAGNLIKVLPRLVTSDLVMTYGDDSLFVAKTLDEQGNPAPHQEVSFNIYGIVYNCTTDDNGECKLHFNLQPGEYLITGHYLFEVEANTVKIKA
ncbi:MAG: Ig-like domain repeat protein, partial [Methanobrevibacter sp.]|nr:Ig-like domain repeat protein [Methanobrevibacter sp.]